MELRPPVWHAAGQPTKAGARNGPNDTGRQRPQEQPKAGSEGLVLAVPFRRDCREPIEDSRRRYACLKSEDSAHLPGGTKRQKSQPDQPVADASAKRDGQRVQGSPQSGLRRNGKPDSHPSQATNVSIKAAGSRPLVNRPTPQITPNQYQARRTPSRLPSHLANRISWL